MVFLHQRDPLVFLHQRDPLVVLFNSNKSQSPYPMIDYFMTLDDEQFDREVSILNQEDGLRHLVLRGPIRTFEDPSSYKK